jgi:ATP-dependent Clp protease ATP-binding subunit ClpA
VRQILEARELKLEIDEKAKGILARRGYDPVYGARPLKRLITDLILNPLATKLLSGEYKGGDVVRLSAENGEIVFVKEPAAGESSKYRRTA